MKMSDIFECNGGAYTSIIDCVVEKKNQVLFPKTLGRPRSYLG